MADLIMITGPTASGKTKLSLDLAEALGAEIVSADSMQVYRRFDIGTAKPTAEEQARIRHHLIDVADPDETYHVGRFKAEAEQAIKEIIAKGKPVVVVGGTAMYLKILIQGLAPGPGRNDQLRREIEAQWDSGEVETLRKELRAGDPALAERLHPNDRSRIVRGLEVLRAGGRPLSEIQSEHGFRQSEHNSICFCMDVERTELYGRINKRVELMIEMEWIKEVEEILSAGYPPAIAPLRAIGYKEIVEFLSAAYGKDELIKKIQQNTRRFAKRQLTWFRAMDIIKIRPDEYLKALTMSKKFLQMQEAPV